MQKCAVKKEVSCTKWWESAGRRQTQTARRLGTKIVQHISILRNTVSDTSLYCGTPCAAHLYFAEHSVRHFILFCGTTIFADNSYLHRLPPRVFLYRRSVYNNIFIIHTTHDSVIVWQCRVTSQTGQTRERKCKVVGQTSQTGQTYDCHFSRRRRRMPRLKKRTISDF